MSSLTVYHENQPEQPLKLLTHAEDIASTLAEVGVRFERWEAAAPIAAGASQDEVIAAYAHEIERLKRERGYITVDVVSLNSDHPQKAELRAKFLDEHRHGEDEVRFFVAGRGLFVLHIEEHVYAVLCERNDLISVPAGTRHWFDMGEHPHFVAVRLFNNPEGWVAQFTGDDIASRFPRWKTERGTVPSVTIRAPVLPGAVSSGVRMTIKAILTDIEGTTSAVSFVFDVLFPYAARHLPDFVREYAGETEVAAQLAAVRAESGEADADVERVIAILLQWIAEDRKATPLKALQGMVWAQGYRDGQLKGHVYPDAVQALREWKARGLDLYVYSSGSIQAQKLIFGCSEAGDLGSLFSGYFDTTSGPKRESASYARIAGAIGLPAAEILFLSDVVQELDAARDAGMRTLGLAREGGSLDGHPTVASFADILVE